MSKMTHVGVESGARRGRWSDRSWFFCAPIGSTTRFGIPERCRIQDLRRIHSFISVASPVGVRILPN
jgi:hypothetical protein